MFFQYKRGVEFTRLCNKDVVIVVQFTFFFFFCDIQEVRVSVFVIEVVVLVLGIGLMVLMMLFRGQVFRFILFYVVLCLGFGFLSCVGEMLLLCQISYFYSIQFRDSERFFLVFKEKQEGFSDVFFRSLVLMGYVFMFELSFVRVGVCDICELSRVSFGNAEWFQFYFFFKSYVGIGSVGEGEMGVRRKLRNVLQIQVVWFREISEF